MSKVVAGKSPKGHYTQISNALIRNSEIDDSTFRLICWMTSHDEGFEVNFTNIQNSLGYGRDKLRKILKNAEIHNHLIRRKIRTSSGLFDFEYHIFKDTEDAIAFRESLPQAELTSDLFSGGGSTRGGLTGGGSTRGGQSTPVYIEEQYKENQKEEEQIQEAPPNRSAPPTQECVCEDESIWDIAAQQATSVEIAYQQEPTPQQLTSLLKKSESLQQTDNPSSGLSIAAGSFDNEFATKNCQPCCDSRFVNTVNQGVMKAGSFSGLGSDKLEQSNNEPVAPHSESVNQSSLPHSTYYTMHPTQKTEQALRKSGLPPWMVKGGPNGWKAEFVESYRLYLNSTPRYAKELVRQATTGEAKNALTRLSKTDSGIAEIHNHWDSFNELKDRQQLTLPKQPHHNSNDDLAAAIAADEQRRRLEQQRRSSVPMPQPLTVDLKAKLQAAVDAQKVRPNPRFSSADLREVESQLKLALGA
ncbi:hypothetical protein GS682_31120 [Nostoc sp. B(2019)]|nr:hypothetical protein [Nostoc sp. B(2019)]